MEMPCACPEHRAGAEIRVGGHTYRCESHPDLDDRAWRWRCSCTCVGRWQWQSPWVAYHSWLRHIGRDRRRG